MKRSRILLSLLAAALLALPAYAAPTQTVSRTIVPETSATYTLGTSALKWLSGFFTNASTTNLTISGLTSKALGTDGSGNVIGLTIGTGLTLSSGTLSASGGSSGTISTSTPLVNGQVDFSTAVNTIGNDSNFIWDNTNKLLGIGTSTPWGYLSINANAGTPALSIGSSSMSLLTVTANGGVTVGSTTKIVTGSAFALGPGDLQVANNLATKGFIDANGGFNIAGTQIIGTTANLVNLGGTIRAGSGNGLSFQTNALGTAWQTITTTGLVGFASTTPWGQLSINPNALGSGVPEFVIGSSTATHLVVTGSGSVGIGTSTPWAQLSVNPNGITGPAFAIGSSTGTSFYIDNGGLVGINNTAANAQLHIYDNLNTTGGTDGQGTGGLRISRSTSPGQYLAINENGGATHTIRAFGSKEFAIINNAGLPASAGNINFYTNYSAVGAAGLTLSITPDQKVGIGTTTPNWLLQLVGTRPSLALSDTGAGTNLKHWLFSSMGGNLYIGTSTDLFGTSTPAAVTVSNAGNVGIGTSTPSKTLSVQGDAIVGSASTGDLYLPHIATAAGAFTAVDPSGKIIATSTPTSGAPTHTTGVNSVAISSANSTATITHGLGRTPTIIRVTMANTGAVSTSGTSQGAWITGNIQSESWLCIAEGGSSAAQDTASSDTAHVATACWASDASAGKTVDIANVGATTFDINYVKVGSPSAGTINLAWEAE